MLSLLSGKMHTVVSGIAVLDTATGKTHVEAVTTTVFFKPLSSEQIENYIQTGEPLKAAGAYMIQRGAKEFVEKFEGEYENIIGLPVSALRNALTDFGVSIF